MLWLNRDRLDETTMVTIKVIETDSEDVFSDLVRATNNQKKIHYYQIFYLQPILRRIYTYFN
jgi:lipid II:glycine glycyltransferase (peptidoglycan interpeptide bridge formation enzyme)